MKTPDADHVAQAHQLLRRGEVAAALQHLRPALEATPAWPQSLKLLARLALREQQMALAVQALHGLLESTPGDAEAHALRAAEAKLSGHGEQLIAAARRAVELDPAQPLAVALLTEALRDRLRLSEALAVATRCLERNPRDWGTLLARADVLQFVGEAAAAERDARMAAEVSPSLQARQLACLSLLYLDEPPAQDSAPADADSQAVLDHHARLCADIPPLRLPVPARRLPEEAHPLRVGLLSADLRRHPVGLFVEPLLSGWDRARIQPVCYSDGIPDATSARLQGLCPDWRDIRGESDDRVARRIQSDGIDVLLDLGGHTHGSRPRLLASRCAPLQLTYLGYLFDTGLPACDGVVGDAITLPAGTRSARRPLRLPGSFLCYLPPTDAPPVAGRATGTRLTFGSFNHLAKLSSGTVALWSRILDAIPESHLVLCALGLADEGTRMRIQRRFADAGLASERLELRPPITEPVGFLAQYGDIDIALDPLPFNGGTTTLQALWQGVPVISCPGQRMATRSGASILSAAGLDDLVARDHDQFVAIATALAQDQQRRHRLRLTLRQRMLEAGLCDARRFADGFAGLLESSMAAVTTA